MVKGPLVVGGARSTGSRWHWHWYRLWLWSGKKEETGFIKESKSLEPLPSALLPVCTCSCRSHCLAGV